MKQLLTIFAIVLSSILSGQICTTRVAYDYMETYDWLGDWWTPGGTSGFYTNAFVSSNVSAAIYGTGSGTSAYESNWYSMPDLAVNSANSHIFQFRLASYRFSNSTATTAGVDVADYITVQLSTDGGITYVNELRVTGNNNAYWDYNTNATTSKTANGVLTTVGPAAGGNRTATGDGYSTVILNIPAGFTNIAIDIFCRANAAGEEWWIDNVELFTVGPCTPLPLELIDFDGHNTGKSVMLTWTTASEQNVREFRVEKSLDGMNWSTIGVVNAIGDSQSEADYHFQDYELQNAFMLYRLKQVDNDLTFTYSKIIGVSNEEESEDCKYYSLSGVEVIDIDRAPAGLYIQVCGSKRIKIVRP